MLRIESISVNLGKFSIRNISLEIKSNEYFIIIGPSGAGKTILLETIVGIHAPLSGMVWLDNKNITALSPHKRNIGMVYQDYMLFPHLSVEDNIAFGLKQKKVPREEQKKMVEECSDLLNISDLLSRFPVTLSGGEQQRIALARALVLKPELLLLDEPMNALDSCTRDRMRMELSRIRKLTGTTIIQITHHFDDVYTLADRIALMKDGEIVQVGEPENVFQHPSDTFVAEFLGIGNIIRGYGTRSGNLTEIKTTKGQVFYAASPVTGDVVATLHPEDVIISRAPFASSARNCMNGTVSELISSGSTIRVILDVGFSLMALLTRESCSELHLEPGTKVFATFKASAVHLIPVS